MSTATQTSKIGVTYGWTLGEDNWNTSPNGGVDENWLVLDATAFQSWAQKRSTTTGLTYGFYGGTIYSGGWTLIADGTVAVAASSTNYVERDPATGAVSANTSGFTASKIPMAIVVAGLSAITSVTDRRHATGGGVRGRGDIWVVDSNGHLVPAATSTYDVGIGGALVRDLNVGRNINQSTGTAALQALTVTTIATSGAATFGGTVTADTGTASHHFFSSVSGNYTLQVKNTDASSPFGVYVQLLNAAPNDTGHAFIVFDDSGTNRMTVRSNGGIANFSANNVNLSDERVKTFSGVAFDGARMANVFRAASVELFQYNDQTHRDWNIGMRAQGWRRALEAQYPEIADSIVDAEGWQRSKDGPWLMAMYEADLAHAHVAVTQHLIGVTDRHEARLAALEAK